MKTIRREYPFVPKLLLFAVYDVAEKLGGTASYDADAGVIYVTLAAYGLSSGFEIMLRAAEHTTNFVLALTKPNPRLTAQGCDRALRFVTEAIDQHIENALGGQKLPSNLKIGQAGHGGKENE